MVSNNRGIPVVTRRVSRGWKIPKGKELEAPVQCSLVHTPTIFIEPIPKRKIELLMDKYPSQEWLGYLVGKISEKENFFVEDLVIPPHSEATGGSAEATPLSYDEEKGYTFFTPDNCIGVIHSHNTMGAFHSGTDQEYVDRSFPVSITVSKRGGDLEYDTVSNQTTPCGKKLTAQGVIKFVQPIPLFDVDSFIKEAEENIDKARRKARVVVYGSDRAYEGLIGNNGEVMSQKEYETVMSEVWDR